MTAENKQNVGEPTPALGRRTGMRWVLLPAAVLVVGLASTGCGSSPASPSTADDSIPAEFFHACGHPGATVHVRQVPVSMNHSLCNLRGVTIEYRDYSGIVDSGAPGVTATGSGLELKVDQQGDVTVEAHGTPGNQ